MRGLAAVAKLNNFGSDMQLLGLGLQPFPAIQQLNLLEHAFVHNRVWLAAILPL
jgi:hypothetical protein